MDTICAYTRITDTGSRNQINESFSYCEWYILCVHVLYIICDVVFFGIINIFTSLHIHIRVVSEMPYVVMLSLYF